MKAQVIISCSRSFRQSLVPCIIMAPRYLIYQTEESQVKNRTFIVHRSTYTFPVAGVTIHSGQGKQNVRKGKRLIETEQSKEQHIQ